MIATATLVAVPVIKDSRKFYLEKGRRWTVVEHMLLEGLAKRDWSIAELTAASGLPRRVVIEVVIRLMRAGWVQLKAQPSGVIFTTTPTGRVYALRNDLPPVTHATSRYFGYVVELFYGTVFRARDLVTLTDEQWKTRRSGRSWAEIPERLTRHEALPDVHVLADRLLESDEHLTRVDVQDWRPRRLIGLVAVREGEIEGLGGDVPQKLRTAIIEAAALGVQPIQSLFPAPRSVQRNFNLRPREAHPISFRSDDVVTGGRAHADVLRRSLARARYRVIVHSTFINFERARDALEVMRQSVRYGTVIDIMWGQSRERKGVNETRQAALAFKELLAEQGLQDRIRVQTTSTRSHAKFILSDLGEPTRFQAVLGSCNWLSSDFGSFDVSLRLHDPAIVADLAFDIAELARPRDGQIPDLSIEMLRLGRQLRTLDRQSGSNGTACIVTAPEHIGLLTDARDEARERVLILSHRLDVAARPALKALAATAQQGGNQHLRAIYGRLGDDVTPGAALELETWAESQAVALRKAKAKIHAKVLAWDADNLLITSLNLLSADPGDNDPRQELGVFIRAPNAARTLIAAFDQVNESEGPQGANIDV